MPLAARPQVSLDRPQSCTVVSQQELQKTGPGASVAETLRTLPALPTSCPQSPAAAQTAINLSPFAKEVLASHNFERATLGLPPLNWKPALEASAYGFAKQLAEIGRLAHAPREGRGMERENLLQASLGWSPRQMVSVWTSEKRYFHAGIFPNVCDGDWSQCAHYSQMIWPTTTDVGCGVAQGHGFNWLVCRYSPGGNKDGKPVGTAEALHEAFNVPSMPTGDASGSFAFKAYVMYSSDAFTAQVANLLPDLPDLDWGDANHAGHLDVERSFGDVVSALFTLDEAHYLDALDQLSGQQYASYLQAVRNNAFVVENYFDLYLHALAIEAPANESDFVDTTVEQPTLPAKELTRQPSYEPTNSTGAVIDKLNALSSLYAVAYAKFGAARSHCDLGVMQSSRAEMIASRAAFQTVRDAATDAGEFSLIGQKLIDDVPEAMDQELKRLEEENGTGCPASKDPDGEHTDTTVPPALPMREPHKPAQPGVLPDPM